MNQSVNSEFYIHLVQIFDEDDDALTSYFEVVEDPYKSHGLFDSVAEAERIVKLLGGPSNH